jgi:hypothetical protein
MDVTLKKNQATSTFYFINHVLFLGVKCDSMVEVLDSLMGCDLGNFCAKAER